MRHSLLLNGIACFLIGLCACLSPGQTTTSDSPPAAPPAGTGEASTPASAPAGEAATSSDAAPTSVPSLPPTAPATRPFAAPAKAPTLLDANLQLAAESLLHAADSLQYMPADTPGRAARILALAVMADRLRPEDPETNRLLAGIYHAQRKTAEEAKALGVCFRANPQDYQTGLQYLHARLALLDTAEARLVFLREFAGDSGNSASLRAAAYAEAGEVLGGQGLVADANEAYRQALALDPTEPTAGAGILAQQKDSNNVADRLRAFLGMIRGNPRDSELAFQAATVLEEANLCPQAVLFYEHAYEMAMLAGDREASRRILPAYCNSMLATNDRREWRRALTVFARTPGTDSSAQVQSLLFEACQMLGDTTQGGQLRITLRVLLRDRYDSALRLAGIEWERRQPKSASTSQAGSAPASEPATAPASLPADGNAPPDPKQAFLDAAVVEKARDLAWFYCTVEPDPNLALPYARQAYRAAPDDPVVRRVMGAAYLLDGKGNEGEALLKPLLKTDGFAAKALADYYVKRAKPFDELNAVIQDGVQAGRTGSAFRQLALLASRQRVAIPPLPGAREAAAAFEAFDRQYRACLDMPRSPNKYLSVQVQPVRESLLADEPKELVASLKNESGLEIPLGDWGLVRPRLGLGASVQGVRESFVNLPTLTWAAPRHLPPGMVLEQKMRLDAGLFERALASRLLDDVRIDVWAYLDPQQRGYSYTSSLRGFPDYRFALLIKGAVGPVEANRPDLLAQACTTTLGRLVYDLQKGDLFARVQAARRTASLLAVARMNELGRVSLPRPVSDALSRGVLLRMVVEALKDPSEAVRAEVVGRLAVVPLDDRIIGLLAPVIDDPSPVVRLRLADVLGGSGLPSQRPILEHYQRDRDGLVRQLAEALLAPPKKD